MNTALVIAAHPDDEVLGCGGTLSKFADKNVYIHVAFLADGLSSRGSNKKNQHAELKLRRLAARKACEILRIKSVSFNNFPDNRMDTIALLDIVKTIEFLISKYKPDTVFTHHAGDLNIDHRRIHEAVVTACRPQTRHPVKTLLFFEIPSSTEWQIPGTAPIFAPNWFVDVSETLDKKLAALAAYKTELRDWPHPRSLRGVEYQARWRGGIVGFDAAEAFILGRQLI